MTITLASDGPPDNSHTMNPNAPSRPQIGTAQILKAAASIGVLGISVDSGPRLMVALLDPHASAREIAALIRTEPAMYARVLRVANSPYYGRVRSITTIERALVLLGLNAVRGIAAAICLDRIVAKERKEAPVDLTALLLHSLATASAAERLAKLRHRALAPHAFIGGLLHNLGVLLQIRLDPLGIKDIIDTRLVDATRDIRSLESEYAAVRHEECAATIFAAWRLPESLVAAAQHHHDPMAAPEAHRELAALINLGASVALASGGTYSLEPAAVESHPPAMLLLGISAGDLDRVTAGLPERFGMLRGVVLKD
jgi:HD-like signal output (HDOD) protein